MKQKESNVKGIRLFADPDNRGLVRRFTTALDSMSRVSGMLPGLLLQGLYAVADHRRDPTRGAGTNAALEYTLCANIRVRILVPALDVASNQKRGWPYTDL